MASPWTYTIEQGEGPFGPGTFWITEERPVVDLNGPKVQKVRYPACQAHCDARVLHAPGTCEYCDAYPALQEWRQEYRMLFTGEEPRPLWRMCPAQEARGLDSLNGWSGNVAHPASGA